MPSWAFSPDFNHPFPKRKGAKPIALCIRPVPPGTGFLFTIVYRLIFPIVYGCQTIQTYY